MLSKIRELREKRAALVAEAGKLIPTDGKPMAAEIRTKFDAMHTEAEGLKQQIDQMERQAASEAEIRNTEPRRENRIDAAGETQENRLAVISEYRTALRKRGLKGVDMLKAEHRATIESMNEKFWVAMRAYLLDPTALNAEARNVLSGENAEFRALGARAMQNSELTPKELRDMGIGTGSAGGYFVPQGFVYEIEEAMKWYGDMLNVCSYLDTATGNPLPHPTDNDTTTTGEQIAENSQVNAADVTIGSITFNAWKYSTKLVKVSIELLQDSAFDMEGYIKNKFAIRLGRILNTKFTTGVGTTEPNGIITASVSGATATGAAGNTGGSDSATNTVGSTDLVELEHSVDKAYRRGAAYMMHDSTLKAIKEVLDKYGRPLWLPGLAAGDPDTINGYPYFINNDMATLAASAKTILFGQLSKYTVRRVKELAVLRLNERFADYGQVAFIGFARYDGNLLDAGTHPVKFLTQHA